MLLNLPEKENHTFITEIMDVEVRCAIREKMCAWKNCAFISEILVFETDGFITVLVPEKILVDPVEH